MKCRECRGACCETITVEPTTVARSNDELRWINLHDVNGRCLALTSEGRCLIWEDRPLICELYIAGSKACLDTVKQRRTPERYQNIRDVDDPPSLI